MGVVRLLVVSLLLGSLIGGLAISKRYLLFPRQAPTRHQFIAGIGIPVDLEYESLVVGYVLKAMFYLPWNATTFRENPFIPEYQNYINTAKKLQHKISRWSVYATIESVIENYGYDGRECLLQAICETSTTKFSKRISVLGELMHILLTPTSSFDESEKDIQFYFAAQKSGKAGKCEDFHCPFSVLKQLSVIF
ncbi:uncharacterized protein LOC129912024 [Episyrphus balteatus]|uniref:uncharacterized protein LOC129912024 n=1 Tax=Episyrphus balteatus TaxID=286459 RepID=UPI0024863638|nr:uncharacterized protein LOC129912024 [Episyrphus balteatus]